MIHLSVAIGRFIEALLWAIARVAGGLAAVVIGVALLGALLFGVARVALAKRR